MGLALQDYNELATVATTLGYKSKMVGIGKLGHKACVVR